MKTIVEAMLTLKVVEMMDNPQAYEHPTLENVREIVKDVASKTGESEIEVIEIFKRVVQAALDTLNGGNNAQNH